WVAHADVHELHAEPHHLADPRERFLQVRTQRILLAGPPRTPHRYRPGDWLALLRAGPLAKRNAIEHIQPGGQAPAGHFLADAAEDLAGQPRPVFQAATVAPVPGPGREQLAQQVAMALLDIDKLKADPLCEPGGCDVAIRQPGQFIVVEERTGIVDG